MESIHIFYKQLSTDKNNIFFANLAEKYEVEEVEFKKSREYAVIGLSMNQNLDSKVTAVSDTDRLETIRNVIQKSVKDKKTRILILELEVKKQQKK